VLQPAILESGLSGIWTPRFDTGIGYCEYKCNLCGKVCPTGAITRLTGAQKMRTKMGLAEINQDICLPWSQGTECIVCEEHCPIADKAIKTIDKMGKNGTLIKYPIVDPSLCVGCAICEFKCPVTPEKAITVNPL
jgi:Pyruvate/2-oxoacid:ferredoxin oxidoreductase delta subunit